MGAAIIHSTVALPDTQLDALPPRLRVAGLRVDVPRREVWRAGEALGVEPRVFDLLVFLIRHRERVVTRDELLEEVWGGQVVSDSALYRAIKLTRELFDPDAEVIRTVHGRGYRLTADVVPIREAEGDRGTEPPATGWRSPSRWSAVAVVLLLIAVAAVVRWRVGETRSTEGAQSSDAQRAAAAFGERRLAVLAFEGDDPVEGFVGSELAAELRAELARVDGLQVLGPRSSSVADELDSNLPRLGARFSVDRVLRGTWRRAGDQMLVHLELLALPGVRLLWSDNFRQAETDLDELPPRLASAVTTALQLPAVNPAGENLPMPPPDSAGAYAEFLRARHLWRQREPDALSEAQDILEKVVVEAPRFARAHEALASVYLVQPDWQAVDRDESLALATSAAREALRLEPRLGEARAILAHQAQRQGRWRQADRLFREALEREPANATLRHWYAELLLVVGRLDEAREMAAGAVEIDPMAPMPHTVAAWAAILGGGRDAEAAREARLAVELGLQSSNIIVAWAQVRLGRPSAAADALHTLISPTEATGVCALALAGDAEAELAARASLGSPRRDDLAVIYHLTCLGLLGLPGDALALFDAPPITIPFAILWAPEFDAVRAGPEFQRLVGEAGLIEYWRAEGPPHRCRIVAGDAAGNVLHCG